MSKETVKEETKPGIQLTADSLKEMFVATIAAVKAPNVIEQKKLDEETKKFEKAQHDRVVASDQQRLLMEGKKRSKLTCSHAHRNGDPHSVWIQERSGPGYILCQKCQAIIRPGTTPENYKGTAIFNTDLFNQLFQKAAPADGLFS